MADLLLNKLRCHYLLVLVLDLCLKLDSMSTFHCLQDSRKIEIEVGFDLMFRYLSGSMSMMLLVMMMYHYPMAKLMSMYHCLSELLMCCLCHYPLVLKLMMSHY